MSAVIQQPALKKNGPHFSVPYRPQIISTGGSQPACLVNASVTYADNDSVYAFGGFDQYTDEVYNHVLRLDLKTNQWALVDNYGDIPGVRMGHTANVWQKDKIVVYAGENEHRAFLSDVIIFDINTAHWTNPKIHGPTPQARARHATFIHNDKLWVSGGMAGPETTTMNDIFYLDLKTWTWSKCWKFVQRYDHSLWHHAGKIYAFGGMGQQMEKNSNLWWIHLKSAIASQRLAISSSASLASPASPNCRQPPIATEPPGAISLADFSHNLHLPSQSHGHHFHVYTSGYLLDFVAPSDLASTESSISALDLETLTWHKLADGREVFDPLYRWHYCTLNLEGTQSWLLGYSTEPSFPSTRAHQSTGDFLNTVLHINLEKIGIMGNFLYQSMRPVSDSLPNSSASIMSAIGADLANTFDQSSEVFGSDFQVIAEADDESNLAAEEEASPELIGEGNGNSGMSFPLPSLKHPSKPILVHSHILRARWPHFTRVWKSQMQEFHNHKLILPEPYSAVRAFLYYIYTDSISAPVPIQNSVSLAFTLISTAVATGPNLPTVGGVLVLANMYDMPRLRAICVDRLSKELEEDYLDEEDAIEHAATIWECANAAGEDWLRKRAAQFAAANWGRVVRSQAFRGLSQENLIELCAECTDLGGRVITGRGGYRGSVGVGSGVSMRSSLRHSTLTMDNEDMNID